MAITERYQVADMRDLLDNGRPSSISSLVIKCISGAKMVRFVLIRNGCRATVTFFSQTLVHFKRAFVWARVRAVSEPFAGVSVSQFSAP